MAQQLILGRYKPLAEAGSGSFGTVQVAWDTRIQRKVAIKCIPLPEDFSAASLAQAQQESLAAAPESDYDDAEGYAGDSYLAAEAAGTRASGARVSAEAAGTRASGAGISAEAAGTEADAARWCAPWDDPSPADAPMAAGEYDDVDATANPFPDANPLIEERSRHGRRRWRHAARSQGGLVESVGSDAGTSSSKEAEDFGAEDWEEGEPERHGAHARNENADWTVEGGMARLRSIPSISADKRLTLELPNPVDLDSLTFVDDALDGLDLDEIIPQPEFLDALERAADALAAAGLSPDAEYDEYDGDFEDEYSEADGYSSRAEYDGEYDDEYDAPDGYAPYVAADPLAGTGPVEGEPLGGTYPVDAGTPKRKRGLLARLRGKSAGPAESGPLGANAPANAADGIPLSAAATPANIPPSAATNPGAVSTPSAPSAASEAGTLVNLPDERSTSLLDADAKDCPTIPGLAEARTAALLQDQNIVAVYDFEIQKQTAYLIMEYVEGVTLAKFLRDHDEDISLDVIAAIFADIAHALQVAHAGKVLHLDIKPENVLINTSGVVKVTDFGLATLADAQGTGHAGAGTIGYMPPEQIRQQALDARTDQWALASIAYEMISGSNPFAPAASGNSLTAKAGYASQAMLERALDAIYESELILPSLCWDEMSPGIDDVVFKALDPDPPDRFGSVKVFANKLGKYLGDADAGHKVLRMLVSADCGDAAAAAEYSAYSAAAAAGLSTADEDDDGEDGWNEADGRGGRGERTSLAERLSPTFFNRGSRVVGAVGSMLVGLVACMSIPSIGGVAFGGLASLPMWITLLVIGALGAWKEHLGLLVSGVLLGAAFCLNQSFALGIVLIAATCVWWFFIGRHGRVFACCALAFPLLGAVGAGPAAPLASGYKLRLFDTLMTTLFGVLLCLSLASLGSGQVAFWNAFLFHQIPAASASATAATSAADVASVAGATADAATAAVTGTAGAGTAAGGAQAAVVALEQTSVNTLAASMLTSPAFWLQIAGWLLAALVMSLFCIRGSKPLRIIGAVVGTAIMLGGLCLGAFAASGGISWMPALDALVPTIVGGVAVLVACAILPGYATQEDAS